ncbi:hypothetical protein MSMTP_2599 [Methanosarcina sp. MTP4]|nr:hypothetical protein MSMTP_2599 [Methanosarcina sp. MTP4]
MCPGLCDTALLQAEIVLLEGSASIPELFEVRRPVFYPVFEVAGYLRSRGFPGIFYTVSNPGKMECPEWSNAVSIPGALVQDRTFRGILGL